ncbi:MAG: hypothetical protein CFE43_16815 [Burkholderiales bacterium PBB3]|nr:MAG: hypothetical protein CFE43_16815 [Burkholderiales bacterium PBB3]
MRDHHETRRARLVQAPKLPTRVLISSYAYARNPDVAAEALLQANGSCQSCGNSAPFVKRKSGEPYLEVHHLVPLAAGGEDTLGNTIAICPNCHRKAHYG